MAPASRDGAWRKLQRNWRHHSRTVYKSSAQGQSSTIAPLSNPCHGDRMIEDHVLFINGEAIILDKPAGLAVDPPKNGGMSLENHLSRLTFGFKRWPLAVHRLDRDRSEEHTSELQSLMRISYAVFCLKKKTTKDKIT